MALTADNVQVAVTGGAFTAPTDTTLPTTPDASLDVAFDDVGYISDDGVTQSIGDDTTEVKAWQNSDVVRRVQTEHSLQYQFTMIETNETTLSVYYGTANYADGVVEIRGGTLDRRAWVLEVEDGDDHIRIVIPDGQVVERGDIVYKADDAIGYEVTIECYPDADGVKAYKYLETSAVSA